MTRPAVPLVTAFVAAAVLLTSCTGSEEPAPDGSTTAPASPTDEATGTPTSPHPDGAPSATPTSPEPTAGADLPPFPANTAPDTGEGSAGAQLRLVDVRSAGHEQYDRVVLDFEGTGVPGWHAAYEESPSEAGSGRPIDVAGDAALSAHVSGLELPTEGDEQVTRDAWDPDLPEIEEIYLGSWFEGQRQLVLGIDSSSAPFRVFALEDPTRVVIDVQHTDD